MSANESVTYPVWSTQYAKKSEREIHREDAMKALVQVGWNNLTEYEQELVSEVLD